LRQETIVGQLGGPQSAAVDVRDIGCVDQELGPRPGAADEIASVYVQVAGEITF